MNPPPPEELMQEVASHPSRRFDIQAWATLVRIPTVFTILADVSAAFLLILGGSGWYTGRIENNVEIWVSFLITLCCGIALYWGGMILNDVFDLRRDVRNRRGRPLTKRAISISSARRAGYALLVIGWVLAILLGAIPDNKTELSPIPAWIAGALALCIFLYDGPLKPTPVAPIAMGACRMLSFLLGVTSANAVLASQVGVQELQDLQVISLGPTVVLGCPAVALAFAMGMGVYIGGLTMFGRRESIGDRTIHLPIGWGAMLVGSILLAISPYFGSFAEEGGMSWKTAWRVDPTLVFPVAIGLMLSATLYRGGQATRNPSPQRIQATIRSGLLAIIPITAAITMLAVGAKIALCVFALMIPSRALSRRFRMT